MIKSKTVKINKPHEFDNIFIETELRKLGIEPLRWAIVGIETDYISVSVSYVK